MIRIRLSVQKNFALRTRLIPADINRLRIGARRICKACIYRQSVSSIGSITQCLIHASLVSTKNNWSMHLTYVRNSKHPRRNMMFLSTLYLFGNYEGNAGSPLHKCIRYSYRKSVGNCKCALALKGGNPLNRTCFTNNRRWIYRSQTLYNYQQRINCLGSTLKVWHLGLD